MASFVIDRPVTTDTPNVVVDAGFKPGLHRFRLVVVDDAGQASRPDEAIVQVVDQVITPPIVTLAPVNLVTSPITPVASTTLVSPLRPRRRTR